MEIKIETGVAVPRKLDHRIYPWDSMSLGDSFVLPFAAHELASIRSKVLYASRCQGLKVQTRKEPGGLRVWLIGRNT